MQGNWGAQRPVTPTRLKHPGPSRQARPLSPLTTLPTPRAPVPTPTGANECVGGVRGGSLPRSSEFPILRHLPLSLGLPETRTASGPLQPPVRRPEHPVAGYQQAPKVLPLLHGHGRPLDRTSGPVLHRSAPGAAGPAMGQAGVVRARKCPAGPTSQGDWIQVLGPPLHAIS